MRSKLQEVELVKKIIAIITARGGSKGLPGKNIIDLNGHPLIAWSIQFALKTSLIERCIVSTDDEGIEKISVKYGAEVPFLREERLATDEAKSSDVILDTISRCNLEESSYIVLLEPTSPYRTTEDFKAVYKAMMTSKEGKAVSLTETKSDNYAFQYEMNRDGAMRKIDKESEANNRRRQDISSTYYLNGAFYTSRVRDYITDPNFCTNATIGTKTSYFTDIEIDNEEDLELARAVFKYKKIQF